MRQRTASRERARPLLAGSGRNNNFRQVVSDLMASGPPRPWLSETHESSLVESLVPLAPGSCSWTIQEQSQRCCRLPWVSLGDEPFSPEGWDGDQAVKAGVNPPQTPLAQGG